MTWATILVVLVGLWTLSSVYSLTRNYLVARKMGLPILKILPRHFYERVNCASYGFEWREKSRLFKQYGPSFVLVTTGAIELSTIDPGLVAEVLRRPKDFPNTDIGDLIMGVFGPNLLTSNGERWARQRKLIAPNINEKISGLVFDESRRQASEMVASYMDEADGVTNDTVRGFKALAINVLGTAGFGIRRPWKEKAAAAHDRSRRFTYMEATKIVVENIIEAVFPTRLLTLPMLPSSWRDIGHAKAEFPLLTKEMLENERRVQENATEQPRSNLMSMLVRLSNTNDSKSTQYLTEDEMLGNLFLFTAAGFDTTANSMAYALALLATYPKYQDWLHEEIKAVISDKPSERLEYADVFHRLPRCLALMLETLRLFPALVHIAKQVNKTQDVTVTTALQSYFLPREVMIYLSSVALHRNPEIYGADPDPDTFRPERWIIDDPPSTALGSATPTASTAASPSASAYTSTIAANVKAMPAKGAYVPWSAGPRVCPGMKMAQVEFVSVFMTICEKYRFEPVRIRDDETDGQVKARLEAAMEDSSPRMTLQMNSFERVQIKWIIRQ
ncbi:hypothetical protein PV08_01010 [Exophiala spinifera]|uniref:Cytochrome P450 n=1 Tax=Exophiala spinifera TaxID=91928 RepID=A0A0D2BPI5_9EURO|nr:uncharacterized protein PV08_01010 [Exophiala spinifera]KIW20435.1 hypothetical protein PV08_01010 [Exophiala spinifera]